MLKIVYTCILILLVGTCCIQAQTPVYKAMMNDLSVNFYTVCDSADAYFKNRDKGKGSGYKPYLRWKNSNEALYYPSGNRLVDHYMPYREYERIKNSEVKGAYKNLFQTGGWRSLGPDTIDNITGHYAAGLGRVEYVQVNKTNAQQIYLGSRSGGLWRTSNGGLTWNHNTDFLPASGVNAIAASPNFFDSVLINVQTGEQGISFGIYRSVNGGQTFTQTAFNPANLGFGGLGSNFRIYVIKYHPRVPNLVFVGTDRGIFRSTNNLQTWTRLNTSWSVADIEFHPTNDNIIYVHENYYWGTNRNKIYKSTNQGVSYTAMVDLVGNADSRLNISVSAICPSCVFVTSGTGIWKSYDEGVTYTTTLNPAPTGVSLNQCRPNDLDTTKFVSGYLDMFKSTNGGLTFAQCTWWSLGSTQHGTGNFMQNYATSNNYVHADNNYLDCVNGVFYTCTDGFLCKSSDNGSTWQRLSLSVGIRENYNLGVSQSNHNLTICGSQDNGTSIKQDTGWIEFYGADGMEGIIHPLNENYLIGSTQNGGRIRSLNGGLTNSGVAPSGQTGSWIAPMVYDPNNHLTVYSFATQVSKSTDFASTWTTLGSPTTFTSAVGFATIAENNSNIMVITKDDLIELSTNGGNTFVSIKNNLPTLSISDVVFHPKNDSIIIVTYRNYQNNGQKIFITYNLGATWSNITYNLGNMPINCVIIDHTNASNIYIGAEVGIYQKAMSATTWQLYNTNLPNVVVKEMDINYGSNTLKAATWGRGLWEYALVGRTNYPAIVKTAVTTAPSFTTPKVTMPQLVTSTISYSGTLTSVYVKWAYNAPNFTNAAIIPMTLVSGSTWKTTTSLPNDSVGKKVYFKVYAVGSANDTTETYKFMYELKPYEFCVASGENTNGALHMNTFSCANVTNAGTGYGAYTNYPNLPITLYADSTYTATGNFNTSWASNDFVVWIDYNKDAEFTMNERVVYDVNTGNLGQGTFTVPNTISTDTVKMRVRLGYWTGFDNPCGTTLGEVEDYVVYLKKISNPLPVKLITFTGKATELGNVLNWSTATERNSNYFEVQKSTDGTVFNALAQVKAAGYSSTTKHYSFIDNNVEGEVNYYRIRQVDFNQEYANSDVVVIKQLLQEDVFVFPNPVVDVLHLSNAAISIGAYKIINQLGQQVQAGYLNANHQLDVTALGAGNYILLSANKSIKFFKVAP